MVDIDDHGGGCCGIRHVSGFNRHNSENVRRFKERMKRHIDDKDSNYEDDDGNQSPGWNTLYEAVLLDEQLREGWAATLKEFGFKKIIRFVNSNTGNWLTVFHYQPHARRGRNVKKPTYTW